MNVRWNKYYGCISEMCVEWNAESNSKLSCDNQISVGKSLFTWVYQSPFVKKLPCHGTIKVLAKLFDWT